MSKNSSAKFCQKIRERLHKKACEIYQRTKSKATKQLQLIQKSTRR